MKKEMTVHLHQSGLDYEGKPEYTVFSFKADWSPYRHLAEATVSFDLPSGYDPVAEEVARLRGEIAEERRASTLKVLEKEDKIQKLLALPAPAVDDSPRHVLETDDDISF